MLGDLMGDFWVDVWYKGELIVSTAVYDTGTEYEARREAWRLAKEVVPKPTQKFFIKVH